jgi:PAS domain S-box-containing protein
MSASPARDAGRVLVLAPIGRDADAAVDVVRRHGLRADAFTDLAVLAACIDDDAGAVLITEEALVRANVDPLIAALNRQPTWSDLPFVFLGSQRTGPVSRADKARGRLPDRVTNVMVLERPLSAVSLLSALDWALAARRRQFEVRDQLEELERRADALRTQAEQLHEAAARLRSSETRYRMLAETLPQLVWTCLPDGNCDYLSRQWVEYTGIPEREQHGMRWLDVLHPDDRPRTHEHWNGAVAGRHSYDIDYRIRRRDGVYRWFKARGTPVRDEAGNTAYWFGTCTDIQMIVEARELQARLQSVLERQVEERTAERDGVWNASSDLMAVVGADGFLRLTNPAWSRVLGWSDDQLLSTPYLQLLHEQDREAAAATMQRLARGETVASYECRLRTADGAHRLISWATTPGNGAVYLVGRDLTDQRRTEEALRQSQKMEAIGQLTAGIAHDFNNMLTGVIGGLDIIRRRLADGRTGDLDRFLDAATGSAHRAAALTHRLLAFSRRQSLDTRPLDVNTLVGSMEDLLARSIGEGVRLAMSLAADLPVAKADANQLESAVLNLAINARDAMPEGGTLTIETAVADLDARYAARHEGLKAGRYVMVSVSDTGVGMPPEVLAKVYDPFFTTKPAGEGTGLGLSMVHGFVNQTGGHIRIHSQPGRGTSVKLYLPVAEPAEDAVEVSAAEMPRGDGETVLVVEDDPSVRLLVLEVLHELGYTACEAADANQAMPIIASDRRIDLMVSDVGLPGINGRQLAVMARHHRPELKVLFMTGYAESAAVRSGFLDPGMEMIVKPFPLDLLANKIKEAVA